MRGEYKASAKISALNAAKTLMLFEGVASKEIEFTSIDVTTVGSNVTMQNLEIALDRVTTLGTPAGTSVTPNPAETGDQASAISVLANLTAEPTTYGARQDYQGAPSIGGYHYGGIPEERDGVPPSGNIGLRLLNAPTAADFIITARWIERG